MNQPLTVETERVDDIPVLLTHMQRMGLPALINDHFPPMATATASTWATSWPSGSPTFSPAATIA